jgi:hypothetical protein
MTNTESLICMKIVCFFPETNQCDVVPLEMLRLFFFLISRVLGKSWIMSNTDKFDLQ